MTNKTVTRLIVIGGPVAKVLHPSTGQCVYIHLCMDDFTNDLPQLAGQTFDTLDGIYQAVNSIYLQWGA